jgi:hypothetical protein
VSSVAKKVLGQVAVLYGAKQGSAAISTFGTLSFATSKFLNHMASNSDTFPKCLSNFEYITRMELTQSATMQVVISSKAKAALIKGKLFVFVFYGS